METVSDSFTTVELKKAAREIQNQKRRLRQQKVRAILGASNIYTGDIQIVPQQDETGAQIKGLHQVANYQRTCTPPSPINKNNPEAGYVSGQKETNHRMSMGEAPIRKTSTMIMDDKDFDPKISPRLAFIKQATEQQNSQYSAAKQAKNGRKKDGPFRNGRASLEDRDRQTPDSRRSYSIGSINSMDEQVRQHLKKSLEDHRQLLSQSSTVDLGQSISKSKQSLRVMEANRDHKRRSKQNNNMGDRNRNSSIGRNGNAANLKISRQRTYGSTKLSPSVEFEQKDSKRRNIKREESDFKQGNEEKGVDERTIYSHQSKVGTMSQKFTSEARDQQIFDVYMKSPYRLMDTSKQRRQ